MRIDAHQHFWNYDPAVQSWISDEMALIKRDFTPEDLFPHLKSHDFDGCVAVQADTSENDTNFLLALAGNHPFIKGVVGWADLQSPDLKEKLELYHAAPKLKGLRHTIQSEAAGFMLDPKFIQGVACLNDFDLTYDILISEDQLEEATQMIGRLPEMNLVIDHIAKPNIREKSFDHWARWMGEISTFSHVSVKLSGMVTESNWSSWTKADLEPYIEFCLEKFGPDRLMIGSDWPVCLVAGSYDEVIKATVACLEALSKSEKAAIMGENAVRFYNL